MNIEVLADLRCHNASDCKDVRAVHVIVGRTSGGLELVLLRHKRLQRYLGTEV